MRPQISCRTWSCRCPQICAQNDNGSSQSGVYPGSEAANLGLCSLCRCGGSWFVEGCDLVAQVQYTVALMRSSQSQLALLGQQVIEEPSTTARRRETRWIGSSWINPICSSDRAADAPCTITSRQPAALLVCATGQSRICEVAGGARCRRVWWAVGEHEDRYAVVVIASHPPAQSKVCRPVITAPPISCRRIPRRSNPPRASVSRGCRCRR